MKRNMKIAIIGANESINILIKKAKEMGYETHVFAWECGDPGEKTADFFYPIDVANKEEILKICKTLNIDGVASITSDFAVNTVNYVARNLGLISNSEKTDLVARNKYLMRKALKEAGVYTPWFEKADINTDLSFMKNHKFPVIVKPTDRWSSKGVTRVNNYNDLREAVYYAASESLTNEAIIEDFMSGNEYSAECICQNGVCNILAITEKATTGYPNYVEKGHIQPANIPEEYVEIIKDKIKKAVLALDIKNSAAHAEFKLFDNNEVGIIEIGARMGGDFIGTDLVRLSTGYDYVGMVVDVSCGNKIDYSKKEKYSKVKVNFILNQFDLDKYKILEETSKKIIKRAVIYSTDFSHKVKNSSDRYGYYITAE